MAANTRKSSSIETESAAANGILKVCLARLEKELDETKHELNHSFDAADHGVRIINQDFTVRRVDRA